MYYYYYYFKIYYHTTIFVEYNNLIYKTWIERYIMLEKYHNIYFLNIWYFYF